MTTSPVDDDRLDKFVYDSTDTPRPPLHVVAPAATANVAFHVVTLCGTSIDVSRAVRRFVGCEGEPHMRGCRGCAQRRPDLYPEWEPQSPPIHYRIGDETRVGVPVLCGQFVARARTTGEWDNVTCPQCAGARPDPGIASPLQRYTIDQLEEIAFRHILTAKTATTGEALGQYSLLAIAATLLADHLDRQPIPCGIVADDPSPEPWIVIHRGLSNDVALCGATPPADGSGLPLMLGNEAAWGAVNCNRCRERRHLDQPQPTPAAAKRDTEPQPKPGPHHEIHAGRVAQGGAAIISACGISPNEQAITITTDPQQATCTACRNVYVEECARVTSRPKQAILDWLGW